MTAYNFENRNLTIISSTLLTLGLGLSGCQSEGVHKMANAQHYDYTSAFTQCIPSEFEDMTLAEHEHDCARQFYEAKKDEMNTLFSEVYAVYEERAKMHPSALTKNQLDKLVESQEQFLKWVKKNSKQSNASFHNDYPYHYYGTMTDYINIRIKHLNNLKRESANS